LRDLPISQKYSGRTQAFKNRRCDSSSGDEKQ
jgi:hypothetical protein